MKILIGCNDFKESNLNKQPWVYIHHIAQHLRKSGIDVVFITTGIDRSYVLDGFRVESISRIFTPLFGESRAFLNFVEKENPDKIIMLLGLTSFLRCNFKLNKPVIGVITSPVYTFTELMQNVGVFETLYHWNLMAIHYINAIIPSFIIKHWIIKFDKVVLLSEWNKNRMVDKGVDKRMLITIPPSVDEIWFSPLNLKRESDLSQKTKELQVVYFTAPLSLRGTKDLIIAFKKVFETINVRLVFIFRIDSRQSIIDIEKLKKLAKKEGIYDKVEFRDKNLTREQLKLEISHADLVCIPFKIVISDVPLSLVEAAVSGIPVVTTNISGIPGLLGNAGAYALPDNPFDLSNVIISVLKDDALQMSMKRYCTEMASLYPRWEEIGDRFIDVVKEISD